MKTIPLHSLVLMIGPDQEGRKAIAQSKFQPYEIISNDTTSYEVMGDENGGYKDTDLILKEIHHRADLKLSLGERAVVNAGNLFFKDRKAAVQIGVKHGAPVYYVITATTDLDLKAMTVTDRLDKKIESFKMNEREILHGDSIANVIDMRVDDFEAIQKFPALSAVDHIKANYNGICVVPDIHGMLESLKQAVDWAKTRNLFLVFLGDILDYGPHSIECVYMVYDLIMRGRAIMVVGNHERKLERWLDQQKKIMHDPLLVKSKNLMKLSEANKATTMVIESMNKQERGIFESRFRAIMSHARHHWNLDKNLMVVHGSAEPEMFDINAHRLHGRLESKALFGEIDSITPTREDGYPNRIYDWVNRIPEGKTVLVGHDIRNTVKPLHIVGDLGGNAYFMDTGSGKGGRLTTADVVFREGGLEVQNYTSH